jgi:hypothetical protein
MFKILVAFAFECFLEVCFTLKKYQVIFLVFLMTKSIYKNHFIL